MSLTNYGAFVELEPGVEGLVHVSEMSWTRRVRHPSKIVNVGDEVDVIVLDVNRARQAHLARHEAGRARSVGDDRRALRAGHRVVGKVRNLTDFGAFIELEPGVDGLLHISDMSWTRNVGHPSEVLKKGQEIETQILNIDRENKRISLGLKQIQPDPWTTVAQRYPMGSRVTGKVVRLTDFGAFVELEPGVDGLLHISQMSNRPIATPDEIVNVGDELALLVIRVDPNERRIGLCLKELAPRDRRRRRRRRTRGGGRRRQARASSGRLRLRRRGIDAAGGCTVVGRRAARLPRRSPACSWSHCRRVVDAARAGRRSSGRAVAIVELEGIIRRCRRRRARAQGASRQSHRRARWCMRINSPGGVVGAHPGSCTTRVMRLRQAGKPVVASLGAVAASGGYYVAVAADQIYANPGTLTGSIGVIMQLANFEQLMKKVGVDYVVVKAGQYKDIGNIARPMTPEERRVLQALLDDVHGQFIRAVADRPQARPRRGRALRRRARLLGRAGARI